MQVQLIWYSVQFTILPIFTEHHAYKSILQSNTTVDDNLEHTIL